MESEFCHFSVASACSFLQNLSGFVCPVPLAWLRSNTLTAEQQYGIVLKSLGSGA